jgi:hypothetical protein
MNENRRVIGYGRDIRRMTILILPVTLLGWSFVLWRDPEESSTLLQTIGNNGLPLYVFSIIPAMLISALHTKLLLVLQRERHWSEHLGSALLGTVLGSALAGLLSVLLFRTIRTELWPLWAWGAGMGLLYGGIRRRFER